MKMKMNLFDFMVGMMVAIAIVTIVTFALEYTNYLTLSLLVMSGAFLGFPIGYCIDQHLNVETNELGPDRDPVNLQDKD